MFTIPSFYLLGGFIKHPKKGSKFYLKFEIRDFDPSVPLITTEYHKVGKYTRVQYFRNWIKVPATEMEGVKVGRLVDEFGEHYLSDTSMYLPEWLKDSEEEHEEHDLPPDSRAVSSVENNPEEMDDDNSD